MSFIDQGEKLAYDELVRNIHGDGNGWKCHPYLGEVSDQTDFAVESPEGKIVFIEIKSSHGKGINFDGSRVGPSKKRSAFGQCAKNSDLICFLRWNSITKTYRTFVVPLRGEARPLSLLAKTSLCSLYPLRSYEVTSSGELVERISQIMAQLPPHTPCPEDVPADLADAAVVRTTATTSTKSKTTTKK